MHSHSIVACVWLDTGVRVPCKGEDLVVAARHCFSAIPDIRGRRVRMRGVMIWIVGWLIGSWVGWRIGRRRRVVRNRWRWI